MSFALPESMREHIDTRVASGTCGNTSEYIRDLIEEGLASGSGRRRTKADETELVVIARGDVD